MPDILNSQFLLGALFEILLKGLFALSIIKMLALVSPENQKINPKLVWLLAVPGFNIFWNFVVAFKLSASLKKELDSRNFEVLQQPTLIWGIIYSVFSASAIFIPTPTTLTTTLTIVFGLFGIIALLIFIQYWMKINWYKQLLIDDNEENDRDVSV